MSERRFTVKQWRDAPFIFDEAAGEQVASGEQLPLSKAVELLNDVDDTLRAENERLTDDYLAEKHARETADVCIAKEVERREQAERERDEAGEALKTMLDQFDTLSEDLPNGIQGGEWAPVGGLTEWTDACIRAEAALARIERERLGGEK